MNKYVMEFIGTFFLVFTVGCYGLLAMAFNTFGVVPEQEN